MANETQAGCALYVLSFSRDIEQLNSWLGHYANALLNLKLSHYRGEKELDVKKLGEALTDEEKKAALGVVQETRFWVIQSFIKLSALKLQIPQLAKDFEKIEELKNKIISQAVPEYESIEDFILQMNNLFVSGVGAELLVKSQDYYEKISSLNAGQGAGQ